MPPSQEGFQPGHNLFPSPQGLSWCPAATTHHYPHHIFSIAESSARGEVTGTGVPLSRTGAEQASPHSAPVIAVRGQFPSLDESSKDHVPQRDQPKQGGQGEQAQADDQPV